MQAGFFLLEGGQVRSRDVANVMMKMTGHIGIGIVVFLLGGFALKQYGWPLLAMPEGWRMPWDFIASGPHSIAFFVSLMFALVSCAIPSGLLQRTDEVLGLSAVRGASTAASFIRSSRICCGMARWRSLACRTMPDRWAYTRSVGSWGWSARVS